MVSRRARIAALADSYALPAGLLLAIAASVRTLAAHGADYRQWFGWADQGRYLLSTQAWAHGVLDPALHHYPPGYSLMAVPFTWIFPAQPFAIPDLLCLVASLVIFAALSARLSPVAPGWTAAAVAVFCCATLGSQVLRNIWIVPWNTTASAPFELGAMLATLRLCEAPGKTRAAVPGLVLGIMAGIRPSDAVVLALCCAAYCLVQLRQAGARSLLRLAIQAACGLLLGALPLAIAHAAVHGLSGGDYVAKSANIGFEWRLLPLRWVTIVIDPRPLLPEGQGLVRVLPWIMPGIAGLLFLTVGRGGPTRAWWLVAGAIVLHWCLYLSYRDLQPYGLWRFFNLHYFKWTFPFLLLAGLRVCAAFLIGPRRVSAAVAMAAAILLMMWRPVGTDVGKTPAALQQAGGVAMETDLSHVNSAVFVPMTGSWHDIYFGVSTLLAGKLVFRNTWDFKLQPVAGGALLQPLRALPGTGLTFHPAPGTSVTAGANIAVVEQDLRFGVPCAIMPSRLSCRTPAY